MQIQAQAMALLVCAALLVPVAAHGENGHADCPPTYLVGTWNARDDDGWWVRLTPQALTLVQRGDELIGVLPILRCGEERIVVCDAGLTREIVYRAAPDGSVELQLPPYGRPDRIRLEVFEAAEGGPQNLDPQPLSIAAPRRPPAERVAEIRTELARRLELDQGVRTGDTADPREELRVDRDNTAWLRALLPETGWIDAATYGEEAALAAYLIVTHSGDIALMMGALPFIAEHGDPEHHAYLYDRVRLRLGGKQRFGSQMRGADDGSVVVSALEDPERVDARRAEIGLRPLGRAVADFTGDEALVDAPPIASCRSGDLRSSSAPR